LKGIYETRKKSWTEAKKEGNYSRGTEKACKSIKPALFSVGGTNCKEGLKQIARGGGDRKSPRKK